MSTNSSGITPISGTAPNPASRPLVGQADPESVYDFAQATVASTLPSDFPAWVRDAVILSDPLRLVMVGLRPVVLKLVRYWDQRIRTVKVDGRTISLEDHGGYRLD